MITCCANQFQSSDVVVVTDPCWKDMRIPAIPLRGLPDRQCKCRIGMNGLKAKLKKSARPIPIKRPAPFHTGQGVSLFDPQLFNLSFAAFAGVVALSQLCRRTRQIMTTMKR